MSFLTELRQEIAGRKKRGNAFIDPNVYGGEVVPNVMYESDAGKPQQTAPYAEATGRAEILAPPIPQQEIVQPIQTAPHLARPLSGLTPDNSSPQEVPFNQRTGETLAAPPPQSEQPQTDLKTLLNVEFPSIERPVQTDNASPSLSEVEKAEAEYNRIKNEKPVDNDKKWWKRLGAFAREALMGAGEISKRNPRASIWDIIGGAMGGAGRYAINPTIDEQRTHDAEEAKAFENYRTADKIADDKINRQSKEADTKYKLARPEIEAEKQAVNRERINQQYKIHRENYDRLIESENKRAIREGNKYQVKEIDGYLFRVFPNDPTRDAEPIKDERTGKQAVNPNKVSLAYQMPDGTTLNLSGKDIAVMHSGINAHNANLQAGQYREQGDAEADYLNDTERYKGNRAKYEGAMKSAMQAIDDKNAAIADVENRIKAAAGYDTSEMERQRQALIKERDAAKAEYSQSKTLYENEPPPIKRTVPKFPQVPQGKVLTGSVNEQTFRERLKKNGITDPARQNALIQKAKTDGVIK